MAATALDDYKDDLNTNNIVMENLEG